MIDRYFNDCNSRILVIFIEFWFLVSIFGNNQKIEFDSVKKRLYFGSVFGIDFSSYSVSVNQKNLIWLGFNRMHSTAYLDVKDHKIGIFIIFIKLKVFQKKLF